MKRSQPLRTDPAKAREWQDRSRRPIARHARIRPVNRERRARLREIQFGEAAALIRALPCCICSRPGPNHPHHVRSRGAGGKSDSIVALCPPHHDEIHRIGRRTFAAKYGVDLDVLAATLNAS